MHSCSNVMTLLESVNSYFSQLLNYLNKPLRKGYCGWIRGLH